MSEKTIKVQFELDYNSIRKVVCILTGEVWNDDRLAEVLGSDIIDLNIEIFEDQADNIRQAMSSVILFQKTQQDVKRATLKERIEELKEDKDATKHN